MSAGVAMALDEFSRAEQASQYVMLRTAQRPQVAIVLGSGLGGFADRLENPEVISYDEIPHFPLPTIAGHAGRMVIGQLSGVTVAAMQGRVHLYEGHSLQRVAFPVRMLGRLGIRALVLTNAAGGINTSYGRGALVLIKDHINLQGSNPCIGPNDERFGIRFFDMTEAYDARFRKVAHEEARRLGIELHEGVYAALLGPNYETPAEVRYLKAIGADLAGMSTVQEVIAARHMEIRVMAFSCVTNLAAGLSSEHISHEEVLETTNRVQAQFTALLRAVIPQLTDGR